MKKLTLSTVLLAFAILTLTAARPARALQVNVLLNLVPTAQAGWQDFGGGGPNALTNGVWDDTGPYSSLAAGAWTTYDLGSAMAVSDLAFQESVTGRAVPKFVTFEFSNTSDFAVSTTRTVPLVHVHTAQSSAFALASGRYVRFTMPAGAGNYDIDADDQWTATAEVQLLTPIPEPVSLLSLTLGALALLRRRK